MAAPPSLTSSRFSEKLQFIVKIIFAVLAGTAISFLKLDYIESYLYDIRVTLKAELGFSKINDPKIALIFINKKTVERFQGYPKFEDHKKFIQKLAAYNPQFVVYEFRQEKDNFIDIEGSDSDKVAFANEAKQLKNFYVASPSLELKGEEGALKLAKPLDILGVGSALKNPDTTIFAKDSVYRRTMISYQDKTLLHPTLAAFYNPEIINVSKIQGQFEFLGSLQNFIHYHPKGSFPSYTFEEVIDQKIPLDALKGKLVIVGPDTSRSSKDYATTPYSRDVEAMTGVELQANQFQTLIDNNAPIKVPSWLNFIITIIISILTVYVTLSLKPLRGLTILAATLIVLAAFSTIILITSDLWFDLAHPFVGIFLCYYFFIPYRLIMENRRSWEYYQKHKLLSEVEQLKTNFISMMSHDLKTPIARITGMTEVIYKDPQQLSSHQREALDTIRHSSDDLLKFINAILQYGSIESQGVQLHKQSKDINALVSDVIKKHQFLANVKKIKIIQELEPMFPSSVDPELMKQVFSNLLENAIKYSPDDSTVWIRSREDGDDIIVEFQDQGMGIPQDDLPNIFMKFFRTHNAKTTTIKGSGLGLYLAQYFVELHKGKITVESSDKGSKFTVTLPLDK